MLACVNPSIESFEETLSTLKYADSAKKMVNTVLVNETVKCGKKTGEVAKLRMEVERLNREKKEMLQIMSEVIDSSPARPQQVHIKKDEEQQKQQVVVQPQPQYVSIQTPARKPPSQDSLLPIPVLVNLNPDPM